MMEQEQLEEAVIKKGAVAAYALQGRKHGNNAVRSTTSQAELEAASKCKKHRHKDRCSYSCTY